MCSRMRCQKLAAGVRYYHYHLGLRLRAECDEFLKLVQKLDSVVFRLLAGAKSDSECYLDLVSTIIFSIGVHIGNGPDMVIPMIGDQGVVLSITVLTCPLFRSSNLL